MPSGAFPRWKNFCGVEHLLSIGRKKAILFLGASLLLALCGGAPAAQAEIARTGAVTEASYWQAKQENGDAVRLTPAEIEALNAKMRKSEPTLRAMADEPAEQDGETVKSSIWASTQEYWPQDAMPSAYTADGALTWENWNAMLTNRNIADVPAQVKVRYAVTTRRANMRLLPSQQGLYEGTGELSRHYDDLQATAVDPAEAVAVWHVSMDGAFAFVETRNYRGWLPLADLAFTDRETWLQFARPADFFVVMKDKIRLQAEGTQQVYQMGAKIPARVENGTETLLLPVRQADGQLAIVRGGADIGGLHHGFLPFTDNQVFKQAFSFLGDVYGWGGQDESVDCSSFVGDVYRSMGIEIPRDADRQEAALVHNLPLGGFSTADRYADVRTARPGALLFKPGHVMLYLGTDEAGTPLVIHCASSYYEGGVKHYVRRVLVSDLTYRNGAGTETIDALTSIGQVQ